jgi:serine phosphatase RsbU (regulator of sigma subunit)
MLELDDFSHLPELDAGVDKLVSDGPGLIVVAGLDPRHHVAVSGRRGFLPSGRPTIFRILMRRILLEQPAARAIIVATDRDAVRISRKLRSRVDYAVVHSHDAYGSRIEEAVREQPYLLVIDRLDRSNLQPVLEAARNGLRVLAQMDTVFRGQDLLQALVDLGAERRQLEGLRWVMAVRRFPTLCVHCKTVSSQIEAPADLRKRYPHLFEDEKTLFYEARGCPHCQHDGYDGDMAAFDLYLAAREEGDDGAGTSILSLEEYTLRLAAAGELPLADVTGLEAEQLRRTYNMLTASESALKKSNAAMERKLFELEAANRVLQQRTEALVSLQDVGQALISSTDLEDLANRVCRRACDICCANRAILYLLRSPSEAEILAVHGWDPGLARQRIDASLLFEAGTHMPPSTFNQLPPGVVASDDGEGYGIRAGYRLPMVAQDEPVGLMLVYTTESSRFTPGEIALLQTFANQAALAIQRAELFEQLRDQIGELETAHDELARSERMERELELAREVQQSVLPRTFPRLPGYHFAAHNEPARQVGGDFYDVILLDGNRFGLVVGDVSDKGMPSALYMALTRSLILAESRREQSPSGVLCSVNQLLRELGDPNMFVSVFYGVVEQSTRDLTYARAGHDYPLLLRGDRALELKGQGTPLGLFESDEIGLVDKQITLAPGDRLILYTDGLTDIVSAQGTLFDRAGLGRLLLSHRRDEPSDLCANIFAELAAYQGEAEQYDDMAMLVVALE